MASIAYQIAALLTQALDLGDKKTINDLVELLHPLFVFKDQLTQFFTVQGTIRIEHAVELDLNGMAEILIFGHHLMIYGRHNQ